MSTGAGKPALYQRRKEGMLMASGDITWFKFPLYMETILETYSSDVIVEAERAACRYARTGEIPELGLNGMIVFNLLKAQVDEAVEGYNNAVRRWKR